MTPVCRMLQVLRVVSLGMVAVSASFSPDGQHLAVGLQCGGIKVLAFWPSTAQLWWGKPSRESVDVIKYSPDGRWLAAGGQQCWSSCGSSMHHEASFCIGTCCV